MNALLPCWTKPPVSLRPSALRAIFGLGWSGVDDGHEL